MDLFDIAVARKLSSGGGGGGGSSDFSTAEVTYSVSAPAVIPLPIMVQGEPQFPCIYVGVLQPSGVWEVPLYKGHLVSTMFVFEGDRPTVTLSGNVEEISEGNFDITGDCTITIS